MVTEIGSVPGGLVGSDPTGRHLTAVDGDTVTTYDAGTLAPVAAHPSGRPRLVATHPDGRAVAVATADAIELWRDGRRIAARPDVDAGWLAFAGGHLLAGLADPVRVELLDAATLARLDVDAGLPGGYPHYDDGEPLEDWGEDVELAYANDAVAFASNRGDDPQVLAVAHADRGRLRLHATAAGTAIAAQLPGERITGIALDDAGTLYVVDSDDAVSAFAWREPDRPGRVLVRGHETGDEFAGPVVSRGDRLALLTVDAFVYVDPATGRHIGRLDVPEPWRNGYVENRRLWYRAGGSTRIARWD